MPTPDKPSLDFSYTAFQESQGDNNFPGTFLDNDLANLKASIDETIDFASLVIRDDGALQNGIVTKSSLGADVLTGIAAPHPWATATDYKIDETVTTDNGLYLCLVAHTSGVFATDFANGLWDLLASWAPLTEISDGTVSTPKVVAKAITEPKLADGAASTRVYQDGSITRAKVAANFGLLPIGATLPFDGPIAPAGWLFKFGQAVSRSTYLDLLNALTAVVIGNAASANNTLTGVSVDLRGLGLEGAPIEGPGLATGTTISSVAINTIVLSTNATGSATSAQYRVFPHGNGDGSTTFTIPDDRDVVDTGRGNMGGTARSLITAVGNGNPGLDTTKLGATGGVDRHALTAAQLPANIPNSATSSSSSSSSTVAPGGTAIGLTDGINTTTGSGVDNGPRINGSSGSLTTTTTTTTTTAVTINPSGGQAHPNVQPSRATNKIIFTGVV